MKKSIRILAALPCFLVVVGLKAQTGSPKNDVIASQVHSLKVYLSLSDSQEQTFLNIELQQQKTIDSVGLLKWEQDKRKAWLTNTVNNHNKKIKLLLTETQWKKYNDMLESRRQEFLKQVANKKIKVTELPVNNN